MRSQTGAVMDPARHRTQQQSDLIATMRRALAAPVLLVALLACACGGSRAAAPSAGAAATAIAPATASPPAIATAAPSVTATPPAFFDAELHRPVSKQFALPADYVPSDLAAVAGEWAVPGFAPPILRAPVVEPLERLLAAARADGLEIRVRSSYRSFATQQATFQFWVDYLGEEQARRESAEAGHSEHQLGTTVDFASATAGWELIPVFGETREGQWLAARAWLHGFALSYPRDGEAVTGYMYEPWHYRYIGRAAAAGWRRSGLTLIEYLLVLYEAAGVALPAPAPSPTPTPAPGASPSATAMPTAMPTAAAPSVVPSTATPPRAPGSAPTPSPTP